MNSNLLTPIMGELVDDVEMASAITDLDPFARTFNVPCWMSLAEHMATIVAAIT